MTNPDEREQEIQQREAELQAKERELRLRELEVEINSPDPPLYQTKKHQPSENSIQKFGRKIVKFAKFAGFMVAGIAIIKVGFFVGMWLTYLILFSIVAGIGYKIFLED